MKANEAPEKIYLQENTTTDCYGEFWPEWFEARAKDTDIEYVRTDAFVDMAAKWIKDKAESYVVETSLCSHFDYKRAVKDFKNYMKGE